MSVGGNYDVVTSTPLGEQRGTFTVVPEGDRFTGRVANASDSMEVRDGRIDGNRLFWTMDMHSPIRLTLDCQATIQGDAIEGNVRAGIFGTMKLSGRRVA